jgi:RES domain-containing protein
MWMPPALVSEHRPIAGEAWRIVESQSRIATMKIVDSVAEQELLEAELERTKPPVPAECAHLKWLLATPFRYAPYPVGSRFRRAHQREGCLYAAEHIETAVAEDTYYQLRFFLDAPGMKRPSAPIERTAFIFEAATAAGLDLTELPLVDERARWTHASDYSACQDLADVARVAGTEILRYESVRDPDRLANWAVLGCKAISTPEPKRWQTWYYMFRSTQAEAMCEMPRQRITFRYSEWARFDTRISNGLP